MLSPNVTNLVTDVRGGGVSVTVTLKLHDAVCRFESAVLHVIVVDPTGKLVPLAGRHSVLVGAVPPAGVGVAYATGTARPVADTTVCDAGHVKTIAGGFDGPVGLLPHCTTAI